jgi:hypothetical protein
MELNSESPIVTNCRVDRRSRSPRKPPTSFTLLRNLDGLDPVLVFIDEARPELLLEYSFSLTKWKVSRIYLLVTSLTLRKNRPNR